MTFVYAWWGNKFAIFEQKMTLHCITQKNISNNCKATAWPVNFAADRQPIAERCVLPGSLLNYGILDYPSFNF